MEDVNAKHHALECHLSLGEDDLMLFGQISVSTINFSKRFQTFSDISKPETHMDKTFPSRGAIPGILNELRDKTQ